MIDCAWLSMRGELIGHEPPSTCRQIHVGDMDGVWMSIGCAPQPLHDACHLHHARSLASLAR